MESGMKFKSIISEIESWVIYGAILQATHTVGWAVSVYQFMDLSFNPLVLVLIFMTTLMAYNSDYLMHYSESDDQVNSKNRSEWISKRLRLIQSLVIVATITSLTLAFTFTKVLPIILVGLVLVLSYNIKLLPGGNSIKQLPGIKAFYAAALWATLVVCVPVVNAIGFLNRNAILVAIACFCFAAALGNLSDIRDIEGDLQVGTKTLPVLLGERTAKFISLVLVLIGGCIAVWIDNMPIFITAIYTEVFILIFRPEIVGFSYWRKYLSSWCKSSGFVVALISLLT
jgi:4-hydroxybenzoate polyprenyltransferase